LSCLLTITDLSYAYPDGHSALKGISLHIGPGEKVGLVGSNGAGKSTLLLHLNGILQGSGEIEVDGHLVVPENLGSIRSAVGLVFQDPDDQLFSPTVFEDVAFGPLYMGLPDEEVRRRVEAALESVGMEGRSMRVPHRMSLGEKKLVSIATVLAMKPRMLALDEPTAALDARSRRRLTRVLQQLQETIVVATHDLSRVSEVLGRTIVMDEGRIVADGPTRSILSDSQFLRDHGLI
jgi:cobalt/nickel transport system ATP-binding protein